MATSTIDGSSASARESLRSLLSSSDAMSGAAAPLRLRKSTGPQEAAAPAAGVIFENSLSPKIAVWAALAAAEGGAGGELIDEDALIAGEDLSAPKSSDAQGAAGCAPARKACANCSCGCVSGVSCILASSRLTQYSPLPVSPNPTIPPARPSAGRNKKRLLRAAVPCQQPRRQAVVETAGKATLSAARRAHSSANPPLKRVRVVPCF